MEKRWDLQEPINLEFQNKYPEIPNLVLQLLYNRGLKEEKEINQFLNPEYDQDLLDPFLFPEMEKAVERIYQAVNNQEKIVIHGDYDADGVTSTVLLANVFKELNADFEIYIPHREKEGYGLSSKTVKYFKKQKISLVITVDCGISNDKEVELAKKYNIDFIITDHHHEPKKLPAAYAIINPKVKKCKYPFKNLAGVGVAFKLAQGIIRQDKNKIFAYGYEKWLLDLVAIGTVADIMPLVGENRTLVKYGLIVLNKTKRIGVKMLAQKAGIWPVTENVLMNSDNIGFILGPRLNAAGRMDHANTAYQLLITEDKQEAEKLVAQLENNNQQRQRLTEKIIEEVKNIIEKEKKQYLIIVEGKNWPLGIIGLAASRLKDIYNLPIFIISKLKSKYVSSGRSIPEFNMIEALDQVEELFEVYGGHAGAAGFTLKKNTKLEDFKKQLFKIAQRELKGKDLRPRLEIDASLDLEDLNWEMYDQIEKFEPFGAANAKPIFLVKNLIVETVRPVGQDDKHLKLLLKQEGLAKSVAAIAFRMGEWVDNLSYGEKIDVVAEISLNEFNGTRNLELQIIDIKKIKDHKIKKQIR